MALSQPAPQGVGGRVVRRARRVCALGVVAGCMVVLVSAVTAQAACPTAPADYTGADPVVDELRDLRREQATACTELRSFLSNTYDAIGPQGTTANTTLLGRVLLVSNAIGTDTATNGTLQGRLGTTSSPVTGTVNQRLQNVNTQLSNVDLGTQAVNTKLAGTLTAALTRGADGATPLHVTDPAAGGGGSLDTTDLETVTEQSSEAVRSTLWFLAGLLLIGLVVPVLVRTHQA